MLLMMMMMMIPWTAAKLVQFSSIGEDDESNLGIAKHGELISFLQQTISSFREGHLPVDLVLYPLQFYSSSSHFVLPFFSFFSLTKQIWSQIFPENQNENQTEKEMPKTKSNIKFLCSFCFTSLFPPPPS